MMMITSIFVDLLEQMGTTGTLESRSIVSDRPSSKLYDLHLDTREMLSYVITIITTYKQA